MPLALRGRALPAAAAGLYALYGGTSLPFYPHPWPQVLAGLAAALAALRPRAGAALALAIPIFPLGNVALGLALAYAAAAACWCACAWRRPQAALLFVLGPLLAPLGALGLLPLAFERAGGTIRRAVLAGLAVLAAAAAYGIAGRSLPFTGDPPPGRLRLEGSEGVTEVARSVTQALAAEPAAVRQAVVFAAAAAVLPLLRRRPPWFVAGYGAAVLGLCLIAAPGVHVVPIVLTVWATCAVLVLRDERALLAGLGDRAGLARRRPGLRGVPAGAPEAGR